jgi:alkylation response protein AidB-like acyl-CoA dehydrogenase
LLAAHASQCEAERRVPDAVIAALREAGLFHITAPLRAGGPAFKLITHVETVAEIAKGCVGTAWAYGLLSGITGMALGLPLHMTALLFGTGEELFCSATSMTGFADPVDGGYRLSGKWGYGSGCLHADWALNGILIRDAAGETVDSALGFVDLHAPEVAILDNWHVAGMAGSGSNMIVADGAFIPEALLLRTSQRPPAEALLAIEGLEPRDLWPMEPLFPLGVLPPMLGAAQAMLEAVAQAADQRAVVGWNYASQSESQQLVAGIGQAAMEIASAWLHIRRAVAMLDETAQERALTGFDKARIQADCGYAMGLLRSAGNRLMDVAGPGAFALSNALQRFWRDLNVGTRHNALNAGLSLELYGRAILGQPSNIALLPDIGPQPGCAQS